MILNYCSIYGDSDEQNLYLDMGDKIKIDYCEACKMVLNRDAILGKETMENKIIKCMAYNEWANNTAAFLFSQLVDFYFILIFRYE